jgi:hypothetical protein
MFKVLERILKCVINIMNEREESCNTHGEHENAYKILAEKIER